MLKFYCFLFSLGLFALIYGCHVKPVETVSICNSKGKAEIDNLKENYSVGNQIHFRVKSEGLEQENLMVVWDGKFGEHYFDKTVYINDFNFTFPDSISNYSGFVTIKIAHCNRILARKKTYISSLYPVGTIEAYLGPKTLAIDQNLQSMLCLIPTDKFGNALEETDSISFNTKYSALPNINVKKGIKNLVSYIKIKNNKRIGKVLLGAKCEDAYIDEQELSIVQGPMQNVKINIVELHPYSDQRQRVHLNTDIIYDAMGNVVADGTSVVYLIQEKGEVKAQYQTYTVSGIATVFIENPSYSTIWDVNIPGVSGNESIQLKFSDNMESIPLRVVKNHLIVGPVVGSLDQYIPDGTDVKVTFNYTIEREIEIEHGFAKIKIPDTILELDEIVCEVEINNQIVKMIY